MIMHSTFIGWLRVRAHCTNLSLVGILLCVWRTRSSEMGKSDYRLLSMLPKQATCWDERQKEVVACLLALPSRRGTSTFGSLPLCPSRKMLDCDGTLNTEMFLDTIEKFLANIILSRSFSLYFFSGEGEGQMWYEEDNDQVFCRRKLRLAQNSQKWGWKCTLWLNQRVRARCTSSSSFKLLWHCLGYNRGNNPFQAAHAWKQKLL